MDHDASNARAAGSVPAELQQYLTFAVGGQTLAIGILRIKEIIEYGQITAMPMTPSFIRGVINLRGAAVPVVDLQARFGKPSAPVTRRTCIVIVELRAEGETQDVGVVVDQVNEVVEIAPGEIEPPPSFGVTSRNECIAGMARRDGRFLVILELDTLLALDDLARVAEAPVAAEAGGETRRAA